MSLFFKFFEFTIKRSYRKSKKRKKSIMKLTSITTCSLLPAAVYSMTAEQMDEYYTKNVETYAESRKNDADYNASILDGKSMMLDQSSVVLTLHQYGCWCYFGDDHGKGKGNVVDDLDGLCKTLHQNYECAILDHADGASSSVSCDKPWEADYRPVDRLDSNVDITKECQKLNKKRDSCSIKACIIEGNFIMNLLKFFFEGGSIDKSMKHSKGFDPSNSCPINLVNGSPEVECCGEYPSRFPFRTRDGERKCCQGRTYNAIALQCCEDGKTKTVC